VGDTCWGKGKTPNEALKHASESGPRGATRTHQMFLVHPDTQVTGIGSFVYPTLKDEPRELWVVIDGKQHPAGTQPTRGKENVADT
jgi:lipopolysaccharide/colanic/teichoic acid biosynthesis glycosyltransferase